MLYLPLYNCTTKLHRSDGELILSRWDNMCRHCGPTWPACLVTRETGETAGNLHRHWENVQKGTRNWTRTVLLWPEHRCHLVIKMLIASYCKLAKTNKNRKYYYENIQNRYLIAFGHDVMLFVMGREYYL